MKLHYVFYFLFLAFPIISYAVPCNYYSGDRVVLIDITDKFIASNNKPGEIVEVHQELSDTERAICPPFEATPENPLKERTWRSYETTHPIHSVTGNYKYIQVNEYLAVGTSIDDSAAGRFYPPQSYVRMGVNPDVGKGLPFNVDDSNFTFRLKVLKPFINFVVIPKTTVFLVYVNTSPNEPLGSMLYEIDIGGMVNVPQNCIVNADDIIEFNFDKIGAQLFSRAGAGEKPLYINPITKNVSVKCSNFEAGQAILTLRVQAENASGDIIKSDNPDIGFKMSAKTNLADEMIFTPNNFNSRIKFQLDGNAFTTIPITAWPVSTTGKLPSEGLFTARGYLRVDFF